MVPQMNAKDADKTGTGGVTLLEFRGLKWRSGSSAFLPNCHRA